jgi:hypothetical protein
MVHAENGDSVEDPVEAFSARISMILGAAALALVALTHLILGRV